MECLLELVNSLMSGPSLDRRSLLRAAAAVIPASRLLAVAETIHQVGPERPNALEMPSASPAEWHERHVGFQLAGEQFTVSQLLELGVAAEQAGFDLLAASDHLQPWQSNQAHSAQAWVTLSAIGQCTKRIRMGTTVTCPAYRYNPAVVAQAFASLSLLYPERIFLGIGSGEALNEETAVGYWPKWDERSERLIEAAEIIRQLWAGQQVVHHGEHYQVNARLYDPPIRPIPLLMAANGPKAMRRAGRYADGVITDPKTWKEYRVRVSAGGARRRKGSCANGSLYRTICAGRS